MAYVDFQAIKKTITLEQAAHWLGLNTKLAGGTLRSQCPANGGDARELVLTPAKQVGYCFGCKSGGDVIWLVAHVKQISMRDAANELHMTFMQQVKEAEPADVPPEPQNGPARGMKALDHLDYHSDALGPLKEISEAVGIGVTNKGLMKGGYIAVPLRLPDGSIIGYLGIPAGTTLKLPAKWHL